MSIYYYCFYRCAAFYKKYEGGDFIFSGLIFYYWGLISNYCALQNVFLYLLEIEYNNKFWVIPASIGCVAARILANKYEKKGIFEKLEKRYKNSPHWVLRGWLVFFYVVFSFTLFGLTLYVLLKM